MKKILSLVLALAMMLTVGLAFADDPAPAAFTTGSITVKNAANGETYYAIKALGAVASADGIDYTGEIPSQLASVLEVKTVTTGEAPNVKTYKAIGKKDGVTDEAYQAAMRAFATANKANWGTGIKCEGNSVTFSNLGIGFYVIVSSLNGTDANKVSANSTFSASAPHTADGIVYEKNETEPTPTKEVEEKSYSIGDTITYTVEFPGANYIGAGESAQIVTKYTVKDTLPDFLSNAAVTKVVVGEADITSTLNVSAFATDKQFDIPWAEGSNHVYTSKYANGTKVKVTYTAKLTSVVNVNEKNTNTVEIVPTVDTPDGPKPYEKPWKDTAEVTTYAAALKKVDEEGKALAGAKFKFNGLSADKTDDGVYTVISTNATEATEMEVDANGMLYIVGLKKDLKLTGTETVAPAGYNLLTSTFELTPQVLTKEVYKASGTRYYDADGNLLAETKTSEISKPVEKNLSELNAGALSVVNHKGTELPSTGGIGTTIFYIVGGILLVGAAVILVARRKAQE